MSLANSVTHVLSIALCLNLGCSSETSEEGSGNSPDDSQGAGGSGGVAGTGGTDSGTGGGDTQIQSCGTEGLEAWTSAQALCEQQNEWGWGTNQCPAAPEGVTVGVGTGDQLEDIMLKDCEGNPVSLSEVCGADATWLFFAHAWCPHCKKSSAFMEDVHASYEGTNLATVNILVETSSQGRPDAAACAGWRSAYDHKEVITLYDESGASFALWEENYTALNVFLDKNHVITEKHHSDYRGDVESGIEGALQ